MENTILLPDKVKKERIGIACLLSCLYFLCMPLNIVSVLQGVSLLKLVSILVGGILIIMLFMRENKLSFNSVHFFFFLYMIYSFAGLLISRSDYAVDTVKGMFETFIVIILISSKIYNQREKRVIEWTWLIVGLICIVLGLTSKVVIGEDRTTITILNGQEDPNQFCGYFIIPILYAWERITRKGEKFKWIYAGYIVAIIFIAFKTGSRGGLLAILIPSVFYAIMATRGIKSKVIIVFSMAVGTLIFATVLFPMLPTTVTERFSVAQVQEDKGSGRFDVWQVLLTEVSQDKRAKVFGFGIGSTQDILSDAGFIALYAHNQWIQVLTDQGSIGVLLFFLLIFSSILRNYKKNMVACAAVIGVIALSMSLTLYVFKPFLDVLLIAAMTYEGELKYES